MLESSQLQLIGQFWVQFLLGPTARYTVEASWRPRGQCTKHVEGSLRERHQINAEGICALVDQIFGHYQQNSVCCRSPCVRKPSLSMHLSLPHLVSSFHSIHRASLPHSLGGVHSIMLCVCVNFELQCHIGFPSHFLPVYRLLSNIIEGSRDNNAQNLSWRKWLMLTPLLGLCS